MSNFVNYKNACPHCHERNTMEIADGTTPFDILFLQNRYAENSIVYIYKVTCPNCHQEMLIGDDVGEWG